MCGGRFIIINKNGEYEKTSEFLDVYAVSYAMENGKIIAIIEGDKRILVNEYDKNLNTVWSLALIRTSPLPPYKGEVEYSDKIMNIFGYVHYDFKNEIIAVYAFGDIYLINNVVGKYPIIYVNPSYVITNLIGYTLTSLIVIFFISPFLKSIKNVAILISLVLLAIIGIFFGVIFGVISSIIFFTLYSKSRYTIYTYPAPFTFSLLLYIYRYDFFFELTTIISITVSTIFLIIYPVLLKFIHHKQNS